ncbi:MAG: phenylalanine--tRNA ligase subunit beta, partial [Patescibacteria group bacterium]|nr:phenylalanine--tRNA ligase subunit beta [Patescibacteria group bacterium]
VGMQPINNIVDVTNYVMLELGQPLHAFEARLVNGIVVRRAKKDEEMETLDGQKRKLDDKMLVIADLKKPIAIAGVMGGANSEVGDDTETIILEAANFEPTQIRKTSTKLALRTEASMRFEKSLDPNLCELAVARVLELIKEICPKAKIAGDLVDLKSFSLNQGPVELDLDWVSKMIGQKIEEHKVILILEKLGFEVDLGGAKKSAKIIKVKVPTWRATKDVSIPEDLIEEVVRIYGYNNIKIEMPLIKIEYPRFNFERLFERKVKEILARSAGLIETYNYSFVGEEQLKKLNIDSSNYIRLANPISNLHTMMRQSLLLNLVENIKSNQAKYENVKLFEIGSVFFNTPGDINKNDEKKEMLPYQEKKIGIIIAGGKPLDNYNEIKGIIQLLLKSLNIDFNFQKSEKEISWAESGSIADIGAGGKNFGYVAMLDNNIGRSAGLKKNLAYAEMSSKDLFELYSNLGAKQYEEMPKFPPVVRDLAFVVDNKVLYNKIKEDIEKFSELIKNVELFDVYQGEKLGYNKKNLAFHIIYQADRTLIGEEVDKLQNELAKKLEEKFGAQVRNF